MRNLLLLLLIFPCSIYSQKIALPKVFEIAESQNLLYQLLIMEGKVDNMRCTKPEVEENMKLVNDRQLRDKYSLLEKIYDDSKYLPMKEVDSNMISRFQILPTDNGLMFFGLTYDKVFNTLKTDFKERAKKVFEEVAADFFKTATETKAAQQYSQIGVTINVPIRDFSKDDRAYNYRAESLIIVAPIGSIKKFGEAAITDEEFLGSCKVYCLTDGSKSFKLIAVR